MAVHYDDSGTALAAGPYASERGLRLRQFRQKVDPWPGSGAAPTSPTIRLPAGGRSTALSVPPNRRLVLVARTNNEDFGLLRRSSGARISHFDAQATSLGVEH
jgi:hypothetical protein